MVDCVSYAHQSSQDNVPYEYFAFSGGNSTRVAAARDEVTGLCVYPEATCSPGEVPNGAACCQRTPFAEGLPSSLSYSFFLTLGLFMIYCVPRCKACRRRLGPELQQAQQARQADRAARAERGGKCEALGALFMAVSMFLSITLVSKLQEDTQTKLSVGGRNAQIVAESILEPMKDVFSFLDDILLVKVGAALAANDRRQIRAVFLLGVAGGVLLGCLGAAFACLSYVDEIANAILNPFSRGECPLAGSPVEEARTYLVLGALQWPFLFSNFAFTGFAIAFGDFAIFGVIITVQAGLQLTLLSTWFNHSPSIATLGWMALLQATCGSLLWILNLVCRPGLQERMGLRRAQSDGASLARQGTIPLGFWSDPTTRSALKDGVYAMLVEVSVEISRTIALFVAAKRMGLGAFFQLSTHISLQYTQGLALAEGAFINMKLQGAEMMGKGQHAMFSWLVEFVAAFALCCVVVCTFNVLHAKDNLVFKYGATACAFAAESSCLTEYSHYFGGLDSVSMFSTIYTVPLAVFIKVMYRIARSALYALQDFRYMVMVSSVGFFALFLPAVIAMGLAPRQNAMIAVLVMMVPYLSAMVPFWARLQKHLRELASPRSLDTNHVWSRRPTTSWRQDLLPHSDSMLQGTLVAQLSQPLP